MDLPGHRCMTSPDRSERAAARRERRAAVTDPDVVMAAGAALLATRSWSVRDLRGRLVALGYRLELIDGVIARLTAMGYLDDERYAAAWVASRDRSRPRGSMALRRELQRRGIETGVIEAALAEREPAADAEGAPPAPEIAPRADVAAARTLLTRRAAALAREPDPRRRRQRAYALLARNGFDPEVCAEVTAAYAVAEAGPDA